MMNRVLIRNFKCLRDVPIELERFTVFVGPNASGKSSILQAVDTLCRSFRNQAGNVDGELSQAMSKIPKRNDQRSNPEAEPSQPASPDPSGHVELAAGYAGKAYRYRMQSPSHSGDRPVNLGAGPGHQWSGDGRGVATDLNSDDWKPFQGKQSPLPLSVLLRLEASKLISAQAASPDPTVMAPDGTGLHSALASMALNDPDSWQRLQTDLRRIIPTIRRLRHTKTTPASLLFDTVGADSLSALQVSEGTLLVLGLLAALHAPGRPSLMLLDDLDRALHPRAQKELIALLRGLLETSPDLQILATTHSPYMLDSMEPNEVRMTILRDDGATICATLASHPKFERWKDEMTPGEMWSLFGEKWLVEQMASA
jgi:predicted ATPase